MLINILIWITISMVIYPYGFITLKLFKLNTNNIDPIITLIIGLLPLSIIATLFGFIYKINLLFFSLTLVTSFFIFIKYNNDIKLNIIQFTKGLKALDVIVKSALLFFIITLGITAAMPTNIPDDGFYYLQTVKWANEVGVPISVAKYGIQYGQFSTWHILQAIFNFSFISGNRQNNINGWILLIYTFYFLKNFSDNHKKNIFTLIALTLIVPLLFFVTAPSPDLPVFTISIIVFNIFLFNKNNIPNYILMTLLSLIAISIKTTSFFLFILILLQYKSQVIDNKRLVYVSILVATIIIVKSMITTGTFIFPFDFYKPIWIKWRVNQEIIDEGNIILKNYPFMIDYNINTNFIPLLIKIKIWITQGGYKGAMNILWVIGIVSVTISSIITKNKKYITITITSIINLIVLWFLSPYYRFAFPIILIDFIILILLLDIKLNQLHLNSLIVIVLLSNVIWLTPLKKTILKFSKNNIVNIYYPLKSEYILLRAKPFISEKYDEGIFNGEKVFIAPKDLYSWDAPIPCVSKYYFERFNSEKKLTPPINN